MGSGTWRAHGQLSGFWKMWEPRGLGAYVGRKQAVRLRGQGRSSNLRASRILRELGQRGAREGSVGGLVTHPSEGRQTSVSSVGLSSVKPIISPAFSLRFGEPCLRSLIYLF